MDITVTVDMAYRQEHAEFMAIRSIPIYSETSLLLDFGIPTGRWSEAEIAFAIERCEHFGHRAKRYADSAWWLAGADAWRRLRDSAVR